MATEKALAAKRLRRTCAACGKRFDRKVLASGRLSRAAACSDECKKVLVMRRAEWTPEEDKFIHEYANELPWVKFFAEFKRQGTMNGWRRRTGNALARRLYRLGYTKQAEYNLINLCEVARTLGVSRMIPASWVAKGLVPIGYKNPLNGHTYISVEKVHELAQERPDCFAGISYERLYVLFGDQELCESIARDFPVKRGMPRKVFCVTTGKTFGSATEAAKEIFVTRQAITKACRDGSKCLGREYKFAA